MGLSGPLRSPCFPLWLSVEDRALGIVGLESGSGPIIPDLSRLRILGGTLAARGSVAKTPYFLETISCLAVIMGETG